MVEALVEEISKHETLSKVKFSSIQINPNTISTPHKDNNLEGYPSIAMRLGGFEGGRLRIGGHAPISMCERTGVLDGSTTPIVIAI